MKTKETFKERLLDSLLELLFAAVFLAIGIGLVLLFKKNPWELDFETLALIGIGAAAVLIATIAIVVYLVKKIKKRKKTE